MRLHRLALLTTLLAGFAASAFAQSYPNKAIRVIYPFQAGGTGDIVFRMLMPALEQRMGQKIIFESHTGAGGNVGGKLVAGAPPDGYTLLLTATNVLVVNQHLFPEMPFNPATAFAPITVVVEVPSVFFVNASLPAHTLREFVDFAKANPGRVNFASPGIGTTPHLNVELFAQIAGLQLTHVPYRGLPDAMTALLAGDVQLYLAGLAPARGNLKAGKLRAIAVGGHDRLSALPDVPTVSEAGYPGFEAGNWFGLVAPADTDSAIVQRWVTEIQFALNQPDVKKRLTDDGLLPGGIPAEAFKARLAREADLWKGVIMSRQIKPE